MTIEIVCPSCGRMLRIAAEHAGKQIRCPACQQVSISPGSATAAGATDAADRASMNEPSGDATLWHVRTPEGAVYGPIRWDVVLSWADEGRVADDCELGNSAEGPWQPASSLISGLGSSVLSAANPPEQLGASASNPPYTPQPVTSGSSFSPSASGYLAPHRGPLVLIMGILGFFIGCPVFSVVAWILGTRDLREMRAGRMDPSGETMTQVGMILGLVLSVLWLAVTFILLTIFFVAVGMRL